MFEVPSVNSKDQFLEQAKAARLERAFERKKESAALTIQSYARGHFARKKLKNDIRKEFDDSFLEFTEEKKLQPAVDMYKIIRRLMYVINEDNSDKERFEKVCKYIIASVETDSLKKSYIAVSFNKEFAVQWIHHIKTLLWQCCAYLKTLKPDNSQDTKEIVLYLHMLISFTSINSWKILNSKQGESLKPAMNKLCDNIMGHLVTKGLFSVLQTILLKGLVRVKPCLKKATLLAIINLSIRPVVSSQFSNNLMNLFLLHILSVPALILHFSNFTPECLAVLSAHNIFKHSLDLLVSEQNARILFNALEGNYALCLIANLIHMAHSDLDNLQANLLDFINVITRIMESCQKYVVNKKSNLTHWHPVLGWFAQKLDHGLHESLALVKRQVQLLWSGTMIKTMFSHLVECVQTQPQSTSPTNESPFNSPFKSSVFRKVVEKASSSRLNNIRYRRLGSPETTLVALTCNLYETALATLSQMKLDILTGLCYQDMVLPNLWKFISSLGPGNGLKAFLDHLAVTTKTCCPEFQILVLFCDCATHLITILDDVELYEQQKPFMLEDLVSISAFLNQLVFKLIWNNLIDAKAVKSNALLTSAHTLLMLLYKRDCRHSYTPPDHWLIKEVRVSSFMNDLEKGKKAAQVLMQQVPHIIPHKERVVLFKNASVRIVEDGYHQLSSIPPQSLKGVIRVRFINEQGLDEAGIDQDGVFKEFLEETIKKVFDPTLNLFRATSEERLFPSPTSYIHENHLSLFEFVGKMLGKALYEGIVVDVPFASFFLSQVLGHTHSALYSSIDELPSLDPELYKSLTYIKHYKGDLRDLDLTFSIDEDCMGQIITHELLPGGKAVAVSSENKISYIHLMAHFRMHVQIHDQTNAFIKGFRTIVNPDWLTMFSTPELQRLISGDNTPIDLTDLRKHTKYFGGFHNNHRVINWLWDVLEKDFTQEQHQKFLKFVTSCSKPPLLGFAHLEPAFSIRCVEVSDDQDTGDTVGSVLRGFFTIRKRDPVHRLPTSSTCFNLLKLPNYQRKATLREKLKYAITCNTGFELS
ncbi:hypothetical protein JTE90_018685 [Oedothorax gibbosus]|uniref:Ubiquitin-protein ligase E3B n=1 Tax=Oedothorax gibbosus TaxID=931172 RepID=A0AAV6V082_9ARAC|nr:hypothetical protein JTE90_018685 [Oedothorax gibbosus]